MLIYPLAFRTALQNNKLEMFERQTISVFLCTLVEKFNFRMRNRLNVYECRYRYVFTNKSTSEHRGVSLKTFLIRYH